MEAWDFAERLLSDDGSAARGPAAPIERAAPAVVEGGAALAEEAGAGAARQGGLSAAEEARAVEMVARCGRLGLWGEARAVYDACAPRAASVARLQTALLARA